MNSFLTGSRVYGTPRPDSDVDLVIRVDEPTARLLWRMMGAGGREGYNGSAVRFGRLNLIICTTDDAYIAWRSGTDELKARSRAEGPVPRDDAVAKFQELFRLFGVDCVAPSGHHQDLGDPPEVLSLEEVGG